MAKRREKVRKQDIGVAITRIAGPSGGSPDKRWLVDCSGRKDENPCFEKSWEGWAIITRRAARKMDLVRRTLMEDTGR